MKTNEQKEKQRAVIVGLCRTQKEEDATKVEMEELVRLLATAGATTVGRLWQFKDSPDPATCIGSGKLNELSELCRNETVDLVVFNDELSPSQIRNIEDALDGPDVIDRTMLILDIFSLHAVSGEGKIQVELAQLKYTAPRLSGKGKALSRQEGRIGTRGPGESKLETDRRYLKQREALLRAQIAGLTKNRATMRAARERSGIPKIAIVGYTNAGKSTLLNRLTDAGVMEADKLFATLDPTTRRLTLPDKTEVLLTDTVGFIRRLPHHLIDAFRSTLEEAVHADLLLLLCDISDPEAETELRVTEELLSSLGAGQTPRLIVYNKCDRAASFREEPYRPGSRRVFLSARDGRGIHALLCAIAECLKDGKKEVELLLPYERAGILNTLKKECLPLGDASYEENGIRVKFLLDNKNYNKYSEFISGQKENG